MYSLHRNACFALAFFMALAMTAGCGKEEPSAAVNPSSGGATGTAPKIDTLVGKWKIEKAEGSMAEGNVGTVYEFNADGTMLVGGMTKGTFKLDGRKMATDMSGIKMDVEFELKDGGSTLVYRITSGDQTFTMKRQ